MTMPRNSEQGIHATTAAETEQYVRWAAEHEAKSRCTISPVLLKLYRHKRLRPRLRSLAIRLEGGRFFSSTLRAMFERYHDVTIGEYTYGCCLIPGRMPRGTTIGRYSSLAGQVQVFRRNHPIERLSTHPFFYNAGIGLLDQDAIARPSENPLMIGHDVWIGNETIILPRCRRIGDGAVIGAGTVVTRDVPDFAIVAGNPGKVLRLRFEPEMCRRVAASRWWDRPLSEVVRFMPEMLDRVDRIPEGHPLLQKACESSTIEHGVHDPLAALTKEGVR